MFILQLFLSSHWRCCIKIWHIFHFHHFCKWSPVIGLMSVGPIQVRWNVTLLSADNCLYFKVFFLAFLPFNRLMNKPISIVSSLKIFISYGLTIDMGLISAAQQTRFYSRQQILEAFCCVWLLFLNLLLRMSSRLLLWPIVTLCIYSGVLVLNVNSWSALPVLLCFAYRSTVSYCRLKR